MIFGQVMANIRHGGGSRTVAFRPFSEVVRCCFFLDGGGRSHRKKSLQVHLTLQVCLGSTIVPALIISWGEQSVTLLILVAQT